METFMHNSKLLLLLNSTHNIWEQDGFALMIQLERVLCGVGGWVGWVTYQLPYPAHCGLIKNVFLLVC